MTVVFDETGADTGLPYKGDFTVKCALTIQGKHAVALEKTRLMADTANPSGDLAGIALTLSEVRARIISAPEWWTESDNGASLLDENILLRIFDKCMNCENAWHRLIKSSAEEAKKAEEKAAADAIKAQEEAAAEKAKAKAEGK